MRTLRNNKYKYTTDRAVIEVDSSKPIVAVDFDGTLVINNYPFIENPNLELLNFIREHRKDYVWILWTCRHDEQLRYALEWLEVEQGIVFDYVNENAYWKIEQYGDSRKVYADYYLDDKNTTLEILCSKNSKK